MTFDWNNQIAVMLEESMCVAIESLGTGVLKKCGSEIERAMLMALWSRGVWRGIVKMTEDADLFGIKVSAGCEHELGRLIMAQQVKIDQYRVDFCLAAELPNSGRTAVVAVECDGHDFHERTKEQVARDKARDRALALAGVVTMRFAGSEIWKDAGDCADEVFAYFYNELVEDQKRAKSRQDITSRMMGEGGEAA